MFMKPLIGNCISVAFPVLDRKGVHRDAVVSDLSDSGDNVAYGNAVRNGIGRLGDHHATQGFPKVFDQFVSVRGFPVVIGVEVKRDQNGCGSLVST